MIGENSSLYRLNYPDCIAATKQLDGAQPFSTKKKGVVCEKPPSLERAGRRKGMDRFFAPMGRQKRKAKLFNTHQDCHSSKYRHSRERSHSEKRGKKRCASPI